MKKHRIRRYLSISALVLAGLVALHALGGCMLARREGRLASRNPETGIIIGAEPRTLGPGDAETAVLLVHGHVGDPRNFADLPERLANEGYRVRVMLLPGHGTEPADYAKTNPEELIESVRAEYEVLRAEHDRVIIGGFSMGGSLATIIASEEDPDGLILIAPYYGVRYHWYYILTPETWTTITAPVVPYVYKGKLFLQVNREVDMDDVGSYTWVPSRGIKTLQALGRRAFEPSVAEKIDCPVLWLQSPNDEAASFEKSERVFDLIASEQKESAVYPESNHHLLFDHDREAVKDRVVEWVGGEIW